MPIYEFHCPACDRTFEKLSKMADNDQPCPGCGKPAKKAISLPAKGQMGTPAGPPACAATCGKTSGFG